MEKFKLVSPSLKYEKELNDFKEEVLKSGANDMFAGCGDLGKMSVEEFIEYSKLLGNSETCPQDKVPSDYYLMIRNEDNRLVGMIDLRHHIEHPILKVWGGHIGYSIRPSEQGKGYAKIMLKLDLEKAKELGLKKVLVTCGRDNQRSMKTIISCGGKYEDSVKVSNETIDRYWIDLEGK